MNWLLRLINPAEYKRRREAQIREWDSVKFCPSCGIRLVRLSEGISYNPRTGRELQRRVRIICPNPLCDDDTCNPLAEWQEGEE